MPESQNIKVKINSESNRRPMRITPLVTLEHVISWIRALEIDEYTTNGLIDVAKNYPAAALPMFRRNINLMIQRVREQRKRELQGETSNAGEINQETGSQEYHPVITKQNFYEGPKRLNITEEDLRDEWETEVSEGESGETGEASEPAKSTADSNGSEFTG